MEMELANLLFLLAVSSFLLGSNGLELEKIIGGQNAAARDFPYQVSIELGNQSFCGGALIGADLVLTAGHCFHKDDYVPRRPYTIVAGTTDLTRAGGCRVDVAAIYTLAGYEELRDNSILDDIAVLRLARKLDVDRDPLVGTVGLPAEGDTYRGKVATVSGYGWDRVDMRFSSLTREIMESGSTRGKLKYAKVRVMGNTECNKPELTILCGQMIQISDRVNEGVCSGDSGGPLVYENKVIGIVCVSPTGCDESVRPASYTRVSAYLPFIKGVMSGKPTFETITTTIRYKDRLSKTDDDDLYKPHSTKAPSKTKKPSQSKLKPSHPIYGDLQSKLDSIQAEIHSILGSFSF